jgi:hypothetical protein
VGDQLADGGVCPVPQGGGIEPPNRHWTPPNPDTLRWRKPSHSR